MSAIRECDAPSATRNILSGECRCMVCARCGHHTGNSSQGHFWRLCKVTHRMEEFHFCCPGDCEIHGGSR